MRLWIAFCSLSLVSCSGHTVDLEENRYASGSRLRAWVWVSKDGPQIFEGVFHDAERDEDCTFQKADDGTWRCFPRGTDSESPFYADEACKDAIYRSEAPTFSTLILLEAGRCGAARAFEAEVVEGTRSTDSRGDCELSQEPIGRGRRRGARIPNDHFVQGTLSLVGSGSLRMQQITGADGSAALLGLYDAERGARRSLAETRAGTRCFDWLAATAPLPTRHDCDENMALDPCGEANVGLRYQLDGFVVPHALGPTLAAKRVESIDVNQCFAFTPFTDFGEEYEIVVLGDELDPHDFPAPQRVEVDGQRIVSFVHAGDDANLHEGPRRHDLFDTEFGESCMITRESDGKMRCARHGESFASFDAAAPIYFSDDACMVELASGDLVSRTEKATARGLRLPYVTVQGKAGEPMVPRRMGEPFHGEAYVINGGLDCVPAAELPNYELHHLGQEVGPEEFVEYELVLR